MTLTAPQQRVLDRMRGGAKLSLDGGKFKLQDGVSTRTIDPRTVESLRNQQLIGGVLTGRYWLTAGV